MYVLCVLCVVCFAYVVCYVWFVWRLIDGWSLVHLIQALVLETRRPLYPGWMDGDYTIHLYGDDPFLAMNSAVSEKNRRRDDNQVISWSFRSFSPAGNSHCEFGVILCWPNIVNKSSIFSRMDQTTRWWWNDPRFSQWHRPNGGCHGSHVLKLQSSCDESCVSAFYQWDHWLHYHRMTIICSGPLP